MEIYLVRHGQTGDNFAKRHQREHSYLNETGLAQAKAVAKKIKALKPTHLVTSTRVRALETAREIADVTDLIPETSELFIELCRPDNIYGIYRRHPRSLAYMFNWFIGRSGNDQCDKDGESYARLIKRVKEAKNYLATYPEKSRVVVVTHSIFLNFFLAHLEDEQRVSFFKAPRVLLSIFKTPNTAVFHLDYDHKTKTFTRVKSD